MNRIKRILGCALAFTVLCSGLCVAGESAQKQARQILAATGVTGGLVVHVNCDDGKLTQALRLDDSFVVQGLDTNEADVQQARKYIVEQGRYGPVSVRRFDGEDLPYVNNTVNLLVADRLGEIPMAEVRRVLKPQGVAYIGGKKTVKPRPGEIDEWTHFLHDSGNNAVANDQRIHPPKALRWVAGPLHCRSHEFPSSIQGVVTTGGRIFSIIDEAPSGVFEKLPQKCRLVARDAFNGKLLWKVPLRKWSKEYGTGTGGRWNIHHTLPRRLVVRGDRVYVTLQFANSPVSVLDAATGEILTEALEGTKGTDEMVLLDNTLIVKTNRQRSPGATARISPGKLANSLAAVDVNSGERLWSKQKTNAAPYTLAAKGGKVLYHNLEALVCLDAGTGRELWRMPDKISGLRAGVCDLVVHDRTVLFHDGKKLTVRSLENGEVLWTQKNRGTLSGACTQPTEIFVIDETVWCGTSTSGYDLTSGKVKSSVNLYNLITPGHHRRCMRGKATVNYVIRNKRGAEFVDVDGENHMRYDWIRTPCFTGLTPANGMVYLPPDQCFCYPGAKINGYAAMASDPVNDLKPAGPDHLTRGEAYGEDCRRTKASPDDWPMYRRDAERSGSSPTAVPEELSEEWKVQFGSETTQPVVVGDRLWVAAKDAHTVYCLDAKNGREQWRFTAGGRIDSAPTFHEGMVLFGCRNGSVYCLRADNGKLIWRFQAAPDGRQVISFEQPESLWPVHGSVAIQDGVAYFAAGRSSFLNGGIIVYALDPETGRVLHHHILEGPWPDIKSEKGRPFAMEGALSDLIVSDGKDLYMMRIKFDSKLNRLDTPRESPLGELDMGANHLAATGGFLDDSGFDRLYWMYSPRWPGFYFARHAPKSGQLVVFNDSTTYAVKYFYWRQAWSPKFIPEEQGYLLFADDNQNQPTFMGEGEMLDWIPKEARGGKHRRGGRGVEKGTGYIRSKPAKWQKTIPVRVRAMVCAGDRLVVAGPPDKVPSEDPFAAFEGKLGARLMVVSASDGEILSERVLKTQPVFDGISVADNRLFLSLDSGEVACYSE